MDSTLQDARHALRTFRKRPGLTAVSLLTLGLAIGAATTIFSVVYGLLLRPLPYSEPNRIMAIFEINPRGHWSRLADPNFDDFRDQNHSFETIAKYTDYIASISGGTQPTRTTVAAVSPDFFKVFRVQPVIGRTFDPAETKQGAAPVVLVSRGYWKQNLSSYPDLSQLHLKIDEKLYSVIGVLDESFQFPAAAALWLPADLDGENPSRTSHNFSAVARLKDGVTVEQANQDISTIARRVHNASSEQNDYLLKDGIVIPLQDSITRDARSPLLILFGAVGFLLLVACANVANLLLAQASARNRELAIRRALGASTARLIRQFLIETFLLSLFGCIFGFLVAFWGVSALLALAPENLPRLDGVSINLPVMLFAFLLSTAVATGLGVFTALRAASGDLRDGLAEGGRGGTDSHSTQRISRGIVAAQIAITLILVVGAGLLGRSLMKVLAVDPGFRVDKIITMDVSLPYVDDPQAKRGQAAFYANLIDRLKQIPGVRQVGATSGLPMDGGLPDGMFLLMNQNEVPKSFADFDSLARQTERVGNADFSATTPGYFQALGIPLLRGRLFDDRDGADSPHVAVISDSLARARWPGEDPLGHTIEFGNMDGDLRLLTIVGVVGDVHEYGLDSPPRPTAYVNLLQRPRSAITITMLSDGDTQLITSSARGVLQQLNKDVPPTFRTLSQVYSASLGSRRFNLIVIGSFGVVALLLATIGVLGVMAYSVNRRTREIGVRVALGARPHHVITMILSQGMRTILIGIAFGLAGSLILTRTMESLLFGVSATDPLTFTFVLFLLVTSALLACYIPALRASRVDPVIALRHE